MKNKLGHFKLSFKIILKLIQEKLEEIKEKNYEE